jgi:cyclase
MHRKEISPFVIAAAMCLSVLSQSASAQGRAAAPFQVHQLTPNVYWVEGGGGNSAVIIGDKGVIVVDAKTTPAGGKELVEDIAKITPKPITTVILTHSDADHVNGVVSFPAGVTIIAHENCRKEQQAALDEEKGGPPVAPPGVHEPLPPADHLPTQLVTKKREQLKIDGVKLELLHWAPAHTSGDLVVFLPEQKIVFTGDIVAMNNPAPNPLIHREKGGSSEGYITSLKGIVGLNADQFVPGHGNVQTKAAIQKQLELTEAKREKIKELVAQGKSLDEIRAAVGDPPPAPPAPAGAAQGGWHPRWPTFTEVTYRDLTSKGS